MANVPTLPASFHDLPADEEDSYTVQLIRLVRGELIGRAVLRS